MKAAEINKQGMAVNKAVAERRGGDGGSYACCRPQCTDDKRLTLTKGEAGHERGEEVHPQLEFCNRLEVEGGDQCVVMERRGTRGHSTPELRKTFMGDVGVEGMGMRLGRRKNKEEEEVEVEDEGRRKSLTV